MTHSEISRLTSIWLLVNRQKIPDWRAPKEGRLTYNHEHRHSRIKFVTPDQLHRGEDKTLLAKRQELYDIKRAQNPERWPGAIRSWQPIGPVKLNPENEIETNEIRKAAYALSDNYLEKRRYCAYVEPLFPLVTNLKVKIS